MDQQKCAERKLVPVYAVIATISCFGYFIVLKVMKSCRLFKKPHYLLVAFLSFSDSGFVLIVTIFYSILTLFSAGTVCNIITGIAVYLGHVAIYLSCCLSVGLTINQFIAVSYGLRYQSIVTINRIKLLIKICIFVIAAINGMVLIDTDYIVILHTRMIRSRCWLSSMMFSVSGVLMMINLIYCNQISKRQMKRLTQLEIVSPYWQHRRRIRNEVTIITSVVISVLLPQAIFYIKVHVRHDDFDGLWLAATRGMLQLFCALNPYLYLFTLKPLKKRLSKNIRKYLTRTNTDQRHLQSMSRETLRSSLHEPATTQNNQNIRKRAIIHKTTSSSSAYRCAQSEINELRSAGILQNQMSIGVYVLQS